MGREGEGEREGEGRERGRERWQVRRGRERDGRYGGEKYRSHLYALCEYVCLDHVGRQPYMGSEDKRKASLPYEVSSVAPCNSLKTSRSHRSDTCMRHRPHLLSG